MAGERRFAGSRPIVNNPSSLRAASGDGSFAPAAAFACHVHVQMSDFAFPTCWRIITADGAAATIAYASAKRARLQPVAR
jgi:hypothetical protein